MFADTGCYKEFSPGLNTSRPEIGEIHGHLRRGFQMKIGREGP